MKVPTVGVLRHSLYLRSEQFIPLQASHIGFPVVMLARDQVSDEYPLLRSASITEVGRAAVLRHMLGDARPLTSLLRRESVDVLHAHFGVEGMFSLSASRRAGIPHFTTIHGFDATRTSAALVSSRKPSWVAYGLGRRRFLHSESHFICVSRHIRDKILALGASEERVSVIPTGVDTSLLQPSPVPDSAAVVHVARLVEKKGTEFLIRAMASVVSKVPTARLVVIGDGPLRSELGRLVEDLGLLNHVEFRGALAHPDVLAEIRDSNLLCLPSVTADDGDQEGLGQVLLEAAAIGRPVVASRHGGIVDAVIDQRTGLLTSERDVPQIADRITTLLLDRGLQQQMGDEARVNAITNFDAAAQAATLSDLYASVL